MNPNKPLTNLQLEILKFFSLELTEEELSELKNLLIRHFADKLTKKADIIWHKKGWTNEDMDKLLNDENQ